MAKRVTARLGLSRSSNTSQASALTLGSLQQYVDGIIKSYFIATNLDRKWYKAWHAWALANSEVVNYYNQAQGNQTTNDPMPPEILTGHIVPAVRAFFQSIALSPGNSLQDTLRLLTLWFKYGYHGQVAQTISEGFNSVSVDIWLEVIPQVCMVQSMSL
jgi:FKBP12-rapamycin complex-associated protein